MFDYLYWFAKLLKVNSYESAILYVEEVSTSLIGYTIVNQDIDYFDLNLWHQEQIICAPHLRDFLDSIRSHFLSLGLSLDILGELDQMDNFFRPSHGLFVRFPDINLLLRYYKDNDEVSRGTFEIFVEEDLIELCTGILQRKMLGFDHLYFRTFPSEDMKKLLQEYGITFEIVKGPPEITEIFIAVLREYVNFDYRRAILGALKSSDPDYKLDLLKNSTTFGEFYYFIIYQFYFIEGLENARKYLPKELEC